MHLEQKGRLLQKLLEAHEPLIQPALPEAIRVNPA